jgi:hypothetical protein
MERRKILPLPRLELWPLSSPACSHLLCWLRYPSKHACWYIERKSSTQVFWNFSHEGTYLRGRFSYGEKRFCLECEYVWGFAEGHHWHGGGVHVYVEHYWRYITLIWHYQLSSWLYVAKLEYPFMWSQPVAVMTEMFYTAIAISTSEGLGQGSGNRGTLPQMG